MSKYWIQKVTKHKGNLKKWAKEHHFTNKNKVFSERKKGTHKYRTNEESLGSLESYIVYKSK